MNQVLKYEYGFESVNGIVKKHYYLSDIPNMKEKCDVWNDLPIVYVRQYIGFNDKNGFELYNGDIIKKWLYPYGLEPIFVIYIIVYYVDGFQVINLNKKKRKYDLLGVNTSYYGNPKRMNYKEWNDVEKIGNIYENKDLLT